MWPPDLQFCCCHGFPALVDYIPSVSQNKSSLSYFLLLVIATRGVSNVLNPLLSARIIAYAWQRQFHLVSMVFLGAQQMAPDLVDTHKNLLTTRVTKGLYVLSLIFSSKQGLELRSLWPYIYLLANNKTSPVLKTLWDLGFLTYFSHSQRQYYFGRQ